MKVRIDVMLKEGVLDPQGKAIGHALGTLRIQRRGRSSRRQSNTCDDTGNRSRQGHAGREEMAEKILANLVIEDFRITIL